MSIKISNHARRHSRQQAAPPLVLLGLADHADDSGRCFPSVSTLARMAHVTERHCRRILAQLTYAGEVTVPQAGGGTLSNRYRVNTDAPLPRCRRHG